VKDPLVVPAAALAAGILLSRAAGFEQSELAWAMAAFAALGALALWRGSRWLAAACAALAFVGAGALTALLHAPAPPPVLDAQAREVVILGGCVVDPPAFSGDRARFVLQLEPHARAQVTLYAREGESLPALRYGQKIEMDARVRRPRNFQNPGAFDYERYLARQDIYWTASGAAGTVRLLPGACGSPVAGWFMNLRTAALTRLASLYRGNEYDTGMMQAILVGQSYQLQKVWTEDYRATGTFHALVISGTHVAVLAAFFLFLLRICFVPESVALFFTVIAGWVYALVAGWQTPCIRSAAGLTLFMIGGYFYRERRIVNLLSAVAIAFLLFDPEQLFDASFQLTFLAVGFLAVFAAPLIAATTGPLARGMRDLSDAARDPRLPPKVAQFRVEMRLIAATLRLRAGVPSRAALVLVSACARVAFFVFEVVATSAVVQAGLALPMIVYFHRVGVSGLSANALVIPIMGLVVPLGFMAMLTGFHWIAWLSGALLEISRAIVSWHAALEPQWRIPAPPVWLALALSAALVAAAVARGKWLRSAAFVCVAGLLALLLWSPFPADVEPGRLEMTVIDVGQGDSIFVAFPDGKRMLVDGGGFPSYGGQSRSRLDPGEDVVAPYLWGRHIRSLDVIASTHGHEDHIGGLPALVDAFHPREIWTGATPESPGWAKLRDAAQRNHARIVHKRGGETTRFGGAEIAVLAPTPDYAPAAAPGNNDSLVLQISYGQRSFLFTGDVEKRIENEMLAAGALRHADVLKVAHHGSRTSTTQPFLDAVRPAFSIISAGFENSYGNPSRDVVQRISQSGSMTYETDQDGLVSIRTDGRRLYVQTNSEMRGQSYLPAFGW
jgi:competence protein ComEC